MSKSASTRKVLFLHMNINQINVQGLKKKLKKFNPVFVLQKHADKAVGSEIKW